MRREVVYRTRDGQHCASKVAARQYIDKAYGDLLLKISRDLANQNYTFVSEYLDSNLANFAELLEWKKDLVLEPEE